MEELHLKAFNDLKRALCQAPALGIAQSDRPFVLYIHEHLGFMTACLMQDHGGSLRPIHYYSLHSRSRYGPMPQSSTGSSSSASGFIRNGVRSDCKRKMPSRSVRTNESSKSHFCHLLPLGKLVSNSHSPEYCYTACTSHEPILMYDVCND